jgi:hypothetical protein
MEYGGGKWPGALWHRDATAEQMGSDGGSSVRGLPETAHAIENDRGCRWGKLKCKPPLPLLPPPTSATSSALRTTRQTPSEIACRGCGRSRPHARR